MFSDRSCLTLSSPITWLWQTTLSKRWQLGNLDRVKCSDRWTYRLWVDIRRNSDSFEEGGSRSGSISWGYRKVTWSLALLLPTVPNSFSACWIGVCSSRLSCHHLQSVLHGEGDHPSTQCVQAELKLIGNQIDFVDKVRELRFKTVVTMDSPPNGAKS